MSCTHRRRTLARRGIYAHIRYQSLSLDACLVLSARVLSHPTHTHTQTLTVRYGDMPSTPLWTKLRKTAPPQSQRLLLQGKLDLRKDDSIVVATTDLDNKQTETATVAAVRYLPAPGGTYDTEIDLDQPLQYQHLGEIERSGGFIFQMTAEVGIFRRLKADGKPSIRVAGVDNSAWDWRFVSMTKSKFGLMLFTHPGAKSTFHGVHFDDGGAW